MRQIVKVLVHQCTSLLASARIRFPIATRQVSSYKTGLSADNNHLPSTTSTTEEDTSDTTVDVVEGEEEEMVDVRRFMHGRRNIERRDSLNDVILTERMTYQQRLASWSSSPSTASSSSSSTSSSSSLTELIKEVEALGLGTKRRRHRVYQTKPRQQQLHAHPDHTNAQNTGSAGFAHHLTSASSQWPVFKHVLPEIAFAGHSNTGKSTLVNAMVGVLPKKGPASISERAGWTDQICFYQLGKKPPLLVLADLPGYGHAVATAGDQKRWKVMTRDYLGSRLVLTLIVVLVDCTRGLCAADILMLKYLQQQHHRTTNIRQSGVPWLVVLTKCDLMSPTMVAKSILVTHQDLIANGLGPRGVVDDVHGEDGDDEEEEVAHTTPPSQNTNYDSIVIPVSAATGAGIQRLWLRLLHHARLSTIDHTDTDTSSHDHVSPSSINPFAVREHRNAALLRKQDYLRQLSKYKKTERVGEIHRQVDR